MFRLAVSVVVVAAVVAGVYIHTSQQPQQMYNVVIVTAKAKFKPALPKGRVIVVNQSPFTFGTYLDEHQYEFRVPGHMTEADLHLVAESICDKANSKYYLYNI